ncbi:orotidine-5'-phosphate decarboxylase [Cryobacterium tagatosivorans]|uniref:Orotidine-5'-phosphate decarboxylase n=1 Tax=Cryobacterium tagatosivorans TaxID=1259199 RepID=A0A4R8UJD8_9MICO|nr:orotidine-5'-phosphate decarboxylase [Cryobacterium tagatosivorans]TFB55588.1 orotidine-5'-phosphate decarboxylase [Cryobacterium tagatosivorans]
MTPGEASGAPVPFGDRLGQAFAAHGQLCVGIDPHAWLLADWDLPDSAAGAEAFGRTVVEAAAGRVGIVKPQIAFFERFGSAGYAALERTLADARSAGLLVIGDVKRGDLGTSAEAYAQAWLTPGSPLEVDAITVSAYMGVGSLDAAIEIAEAGGKGLFVLSATSNPEAAVIQRAIVADGARAGRSVARAILDEVGERNAAATTGPLGSIGVVLGATLDLAVFGIDVAAAPSAALTPVLAPGFGHQGADVTNIDLLYGGYARSVIVSESRSVLAAGPDRLAEAIVRRVAETGAARG